jgi:hypothetical protein
MKRPYSAWMPLLALGALVLLAALAVSCGGGGKKGVGGPVGTPGAGQATDVPGQTGGVAGPDSPTLTLGSATAATGANVPVDLKILGFKAPGLGAWTIDITYDTDVVSVKTCKPSQASVCNPKYDDNTIRVAGAVGLGLQGDTLLATLTFTCKHAGTSALKVSIDVLADGTIGAPQDTAANVGDGTVTCT